MASLSKLWIYCCFLIFITRADTTKVKLTTSPPVVDPLTTKSCLLKCTIEDKKGKVLSMALFKDIGKGDDFVMYKLAEIKTEGKSKLYRYDSSKYATYSGDISGKSKAYLSAEWKGVYTNLGGAYICSASFSNSLGEIGTVFSNKTLVEMKAGVLNNKAAIINVLQKSQHNHQQDFNAFKNLITLSFSFLDKVILRRSFWSREYKNRTYIVYDTGLPVVSSETADAFCQIRGGYLAEVNDTEEWTFVKSFLSATHGFMKIQIAGVRVKGELKKFIWPRTKQVIPDPMQWEKHQPNNFKKTQNCLELERFYGWKMNDCYCTNRRTFLCEVPIP